MTAPKTLTEIVREKAEFDWKKSTEEAKARGLKPHEVHEFKIGSSFENARLIPLITSLAQALEKAEQALNDICSDIESDGGCHSSCQALAEIQKLKEKLK